MYIDFFFTETNFLKNCVEITFMGIIIVSLIWLRDVIKYLKTSSSIEAKGSMKLNDNTLLDLDSIFKVFSKSQNIFF